MRNAFADEILQVAREYQTFVLLSGDIGNKLFDSYKDEFSDRFFNCGVAEANMISLASGMALSGMRPVAYTITPFITTRCFEQIRVDLCYHHVPVIIVGVGAGLSYAANGPTHHSCEDIAMLRVLPGMTVLCPADSWELRGAIWEAMKQEGPVYIRIGKKGEPVVYQKRPDFVIGKSIGLKQGNDICFLATGNMVASTLEAADELEKHGVSCRVESFHTIKPLDTALLKEVFDTFPLVTTVEEHSRLGGLGGSIAEWVCDAPSLQARLLRIGTPDAFFHEAGEQEYARERLGLSPHAIAEKAHQALKQVREKKAYHKVS